MDLLLGLILVAILYAVISWARSSKGSGPLATETDPSRPITPAALGGAHFPPPLPNETLEAYILRREDISFLEGAIFAHYIWNPITGWSQPDVGTELHEAVPFDFLGDEELGLHDDGGFGLEFSETDPDTVEDEFESELWEFQDPDDYWMDDFGEGDF
jgi:hypothetical protein